MLLERRFSLVTTSFVQPLPCGNVHWCRLLCYQPILVSIAVFQRFGVSAQLLSCFQTLCNHCPRPCICCMAPVTWKCGSFSLAVTCTFDRCLDTEIRVLSTAQSRNRTSTGSDKYSQMLFMFLLRSILWWCCCLPYFCLVLPSFSSFGSWCLSSLFCWVVLLGLLLPVGWGCLPSPPSGGAAFSHRLLLGGAAWFLPPFGSFWVVLLFFTSPVRRVV